ncbi:hypothetical protein JB92DRAFT_1221101 [Gautieria morchelliformis]|nr:hypothetical protein JB92DRAFT_1221101 [Gautieria morchelliformis]
MENFSRASPNQVTLLDSLTYHDHGRHIHSKPTTIEDRGILIHSPRPQRAGQFFPLLHADPSLYTSSSHLCGDQCEPLVSAAFMTPSPVQSAPGPIISRCGPAGTGWGTEFPGSHETPAGLYNPPLPSVDTESRNKQLYQSRIASPDTAFLPSRTHERIGLRHQDMEEPVSSPLSAPRQLPSYRETSDEALCSRTPSLNHTGIPPKLASHLSGYSYCSVRHLVWHATYYPPSLPLLPKVYLSNCVGSQLDSLDGTFRKQLQVCSELLRLYAEDPIGTIAIIIESILERGATWHDPCNITRFCRYFLSKVVDAVVRPEAGRPDCTEPYRLLIRRTFTSTFNQWWCTPPHKVGSKPYSFLVRVASFYGYLYLEKTLDEEDFQACLISLSQLTPLPIEGLRSLLFGDISGDLWV